MGLMTLTTGTWAAAQGVLPGRLRERTRRQGTRDPSPAGELILYWMRAAVRAHENPALDVALFLGQGIGLPVLVYQALSERYPYASDRHHAFVLQGARDVHRDLAPRGTPYALHLEGPGDRGTPLRTLAARGAWACPRTGRSRRWRAGPRAVASRPACSPSTPRASCRCSWSAVPTIGRSPIATRPPRCGPSG